MKKEKTIFSKLAMFDALMENIPDSIYFKDLNNRFIKISKTTAKKFNINNADEALGKTDYDFFSKEHADKAFLDEQKIIKEKIPLIEIEEKETYEGKKDKWVSTIKMPLYGEKRKIVGTFGISRDITEHKVEEKEIKSLAKFPEENPNLVARIAYTEKLLYCNNAYKRIFKDNDTIPDKLKAVVKKIASEKIPAIEELEIEIGDRIYLLSLNPIKDENYINLYGIDITKRKKTEETLLVKESAIQSSINAITIADLEGNLTYINPSFLKLWGYYSIKDVLGKSIPEFCSEKEKVNEIIAALQNHESWFGELIAKKKNGSTFTVQLSASLVKSSDGKPICMLASFIDITESKRAEKLLAESEERYHTLFDTSQEGIIIMELETNKFKYVNPAICKMLGYTEKELVLMDNKAIHPKDYLKNPDVDIKDQIRGINPLAIEVPCIRKDGTVFYADINAAPIVVDGKKCIAGFFQDITERKKTQEEILFLSYHDQMTGLYNRRFFEEELKRLDTKRQLPISIILADVDGLKYVNDVYGHEKGDKLLIAVSEIITNCCRKEDIVARHGGDEFIIFLPKTSEADALDVIDRIRKASKVQKLDGKINISISLGLSTKKDLNKNMEHIIEQADKNMYVDKAQKKNKTKIR